MYQPQLQNNEFQEVLKKFSEQEKDLEKRIRECEELHRELELKNSKNKSTSPLSKLRYQREVSHARNQQLLKELEKSKAILRTESTFTPNEQELRDLAAAYRKLLQK